MAVDRGRRAREECDALPVADEWEPAGVAVEGSAGAPPPQRNREHSDVRGAVDELRRMQREAARPDGLRRVLGAIARGVEGQAALFDADGQPVCAFAEIPQDVLASVGDDIEQVRLGRRGSVAVDLDVRMVCVLPLAQGVRSPTLVVVGEKPAIHRCRQLIVDAVRLLWPRWQVEEARATRNRFEQADSQVREAVLHLLMLGHRGDAERVAAALGPRLPDPVKVYVVESDASGRDAAAARFAEVSQGKAWVVRCPVYTRHLIVLAPTELVVANDAICDSSAHGGGIRIGSSQVVSLHEVPSGYGQAFHALAVARNSVDRYATFQAREELAALLAPDARSWASRVLAPLLDYVADRPQDPGAEDLKVTLESWLTFHGGAARQLKIHRNTLSARLVLLARLLNSDLYEIGAQTRLHLALRLVVGPSGESSGSAEPVEPLLSTPELRRWSDRQLGPLLGADSRLLSTLRAWLGNNTRLDATAATLDISVPGARKRLLRIESTLERSLLHGPSARYDLFCALRIHDGLGLCQ